jgi:hypothetical protein
MLLPRLKVSPARSFQSILVSDHPESPRLFLFPDIAQKPRNYRYYRRTGEYSGTSDRKARGFVAQVAFVPLNQRQSGETSTPTFFVTYHVPDWMRYIESRRSEITAMVVALVAGVFGPVLVICEEPPVGNP